MRIHSRCGCNAFSYFFVRTHLRSTYAGYTHSHSQTSNNNNSNNNNNDQSNISMQCAITIYFLFLLLFHRWLVLSWLVVHMLASLEIERKIVDVKRVCEFNCSLRFERAEIDWMNIMRKDRWTNMNKINDNYKLTNDSFKNTYISVDSHFALNII